MSSKSNLVIVGLIIFAVGFGGYQILTRSGVDSIVTPGVSPVPSVGPDSNIDLHFDANQQSANTQQNNMQQPSQRQQQPKQYKQFPGILTASELASKKGVILTAKGKIEFEIYPEAAKAASNFVFLAKDGFYNGLTFHRIVPGFVIQGGDPVGDGSGGPGYQFEDEPVTKSYDKGIVAMANAGPDTNGSQFFIMLEDNPGLPKDYTIFGKVISGQDVVAQIKKGDVMQKVTIEPLN